MNTISWLVTTSFLAVAAAAQTVEFEGRVIRHDGIPIAGAGVAIGSLRTFDTPRLLAQPVVATDAQGRFAIAATKREDAAPEATYLHVAIAGRASVVRRIDWGKPAVGDIVLADGHRLFGRVRDAAGQPLAGVRVVSTDLLEIGTALRSGKQHGFHCASRSEASGIFKLPCALPVGSRLEFHKDGFESAWLEPVAAGTPLELTLQPTGWLQGRVLDTDGRSIEGAAVVVSYELRAPNEPAITGADGSFRLPLRRATRWRISATKSGDDVVLEGRTKVLNGPRDNLEIIVEGTSSAEPGQSLAVTAVTRDGGTPVPVFRAVALWEQYANTNISYREYRIRALLKKPTMADKGVARVPGPAKNTQTSGVIRVLADGFAPATAVEVEWEEPEDGETPEPLVVELDPEATIRGVVRDEGTGKPIAGAKVRARLKPKPNEGQYNDNKPSDAVATADDGSFELRGLGKGEWRLLVEDHRHPRALPTEVELETGQHREGVELKLPSGARVAGKLEGIELDSGARTFLSPLAKQVFGDGAQGYFSSYSTPGKSRDGIPVDADGGFEFEGVALMNHQLVLRLPSKPRLGGDLYLPIEPFRVRAAGIDRKFDCSEDRPGTIRGRVQFSHAQTEFHNLVVVAQAVAPGQRRFFTPYNQRFPGPRSFVDRDGTFGVRVGPGNYQLTVVDLASSVALYSEEKNITVSTGKNVEVDLSLALVDVELSLTAAEGVDSKAQVERIEVRFVPKAMLDANRNFGGNEQYDTRGGLYWPAGQDTLSLALPEGTVTFLGRNEISRIRVDNKRSQNNPVGRAELEISIDENGTVRCAIEVQPPPEIPAGEDEKNEGDADADADGVRQIEIK